MSLRKLGLYCGVVSPILWLALIAVAGVLRPDFSHLTNYISELGARGTATEVLVRYGAFEFTGLLYLCFAGALLATFRNGWLLKAATFLIALDGVGRIGAGMFPCDPGCVHPSLGPDLHTLFATVGFCSGTLATFVWGVVLYRSPGLRPLAPFSVGCGAIALVSLVLLTWAPDLTLPSGLLEHLATAVLSVWMVVFAGRLLWVEHAAPIGERP